MYEQNVNAELTVPEQPESLVPVLEAMVCVDILQVTGTKAGKNRAHILKFYLFHF